MLWRAAHDPVWWINSFVYQTNPNAIGEGSAEVGPFILWPFQEEAFLVLRRCVLERRDVVIEKSREMGASWLCLLLLFHSFLFEPNKKYLVISRDEKAVDRPGDMDSLFVKLDWVQRHLPGWMTEGRAERLRMLFANAKNGSSITGQASTGKAGVGGRATAMFIDEFSQIDEDYEVLHRTSDTTGCRIFNGTHRGTGRAFFELTRRVDMKKLLMHWTQHPDKRKGLYRFQGGKVEVLDKGFAFGPDFPFVMSEEPAGGPFPGVRSPWYDRQCSRKGSARAVACDLDIDPSGSSEKFFDALMVRRLIAEVCVEPCWRGDVAVDRETGRFLGLVPAPGGPLKLWVRPRPDGTMPESDYGSGWDVSWGRKVTPTCGAVADCKTGHKVAEYVTAEQAPEEVGRKAVALCYLFRGEGPARLIWEHKGPGLNFAQAVLATGFRNVWHRTQELPHTLSVKVSDNPGWVPSPETIPLLLNDYRAALACREYVNRSKEALEECEQFRYNPRGDIEHAQIANPKDPSSARDSHGDHVIADALTWKLCKGRAAKRRVEEALSPRVGSLAWRVQLAKGQGREPWGE